MMKPHEADLLLLDPTGNLAIRIQAMRKQTFWCVSICGRRIQMREAYHIQEITTNQRSSTTEFIDEQNTACLSNQRNNIVDSLVFQGIRSTNSNRAIDIDTVVLDSRDSSHLDRCLQSTSDEKTSERGSVGEEFYV